MIMSVPKNCSTALLGKVKLLKDGLLKKYNDKINSFKPEKNSNSLPPYLQKIVPKASKEFLQWFVGFTDAEGTFSIVPLQNWKSVNLKFSIEVHIDDIEILHKIAYNLGIGKITLSTTNQSAVFSVNKFNDITSILIPIFQEFPLQTTKYLDFTCFLEASLIKLDMKKAGLKITESRIAGFLKLKNLKQSMNSNRLSISEEEEENLNQKVSINKWWLLGFVEGEGTFGYKHLVPYFQIAQNKKNLFILKAIEIYMLEEINKSNDTKNTKDIEFRYTLNKLTGVYSMTLEKVDVNFYFTLPFFEPLTFFSRKKLDYEYWVLMVIIHKLGYFYLPEGKRIALLISSATNKYRYTTRDTKIELPSNEAIFKLLDQTPPFEISGGRSHFDLVKEFTISKGGRSGFTVYIYECKSDKLHSVNGSPFSTYGDGHEAIGLKRGSRVIGRYIDTGKKYKNIYLFSSVPISNYNI